MLNTFPDLLVFSLFAPFILRLTLGFIFIRFGGLTLSGDRHRLLTIFQKIRVPNATFLVFVFGALEIISGVLLVIGLYTQIAALIAGVISLILLLSKLSGKPFGSSGALFDFVLFSIALSLLVSGAGFLAFDLPL